MSGGDEKTLFYTALRSSGVVSTVRTQLRASIVSRLREGSIVRKNGSPSGKSVVERPNDGQREDSGIDIADAAVAEHLRTRGYSYTLSVFHSELGCCSPPVSRVSLMDALGVGGLGGKREEDSVLGVLLSLHTPPRGGPGPTRASGTQTEIAVGMDPLAVSLRQLDEERKEKKTDGGEKKGGQVVKFTREDVENDALDGMEVYDMENGDLEAGKGPSPWSSSASFRRHAHASALRAARASLQHWKSGELNEMRDRLEKRFDERVESEVDKVRARANVEIEAARKSAEATRQQYETLTAQLRGSLASQRQELERRSLSLIAAEGDLRSAMELERSKCDHRVAVAEAKVQAMEQAVARETAERLKAVAEMENATSKARSEALISLSSERDAVFAREKAAEEVLRESARVEAEISQLRDALGVSNRELEKAREEKTALRDRVAELNRENTALVNSLNAAREEASRAKSLESALAAERSDRSSAECDLRQKISRDAQAISTLESHISRLETQLRNAEGEISRVRKESQETNRSAGEKNRSALEREISRRENAEREKKRMEEEKGALEREVRVEREGKGRAERELAAARRLLEETREILAARVEPVGYGVAAQVPSVKVNASGPGPNASGARPRRKMEQGDIRAFENAFETAFGADVTAADRHIDDAVARLDAIAAPSTSAAKIATNTQPHHPAALKTEPQPQSQQGKEEERSMAAERKRMEAEMAERERLFEERQRRQERLMEETMRKQREQEELRLSREREEEARKREAEIEREVERRTLRETVDRQRQELQRLVNTQEQQQQQHQQQLEQQQRQQQIEQQQRQQQLEQQQKQMEQERKQREKEKAEEEERGKRLTAHVQRRPTASPSKSPRFTVSAVESVSPVSHQPPSPHSENDNSNYSTTHSSSGDLFLGDVDVHLPEGKSAPSGPRLGVPMLNIGSLESKEPKESKESVESEESKESEDAPGSVGDRSASHSDIGNDDSNNNSNTANDDDRNKSTEGENEISEVEEVEEDNEKTKEQQEKQEQEEQGKTEIPVESEAARIARERRERMAAQEAAWRAQAEEISDNGATGNTAAETGPKEESEDDEGSKTGGDKPADSLVDGRVLAATSALVDEYRDRILQRRREREENERKDSGVNYSDEEFPDESGPQDNDNNDTDNNDNNNNNEGEESSGVSSLIIDDVEITGDSGGSSLGSGGSGSSMF